VSRRTMLQGSAAALLTTALGQLAHAQSPKQSAPDPERFFDDWRTLSNRLLEKSEIDEEAYIRGLDALIAQQQLAAMPRREKVFFEEEGLKTGASWMEDKIFIIELTMDPGAIVQPHNHPSHNSLSVGLLGSCTFSHYEVPNDAPAAKPDTPHFQVQRTRSGLLTPGRRSDLTRTRDNVHAFQAGDQGATILDFTTTVGDPSRSFSVLEIDSKPMGKQGDAFEARWIGNPYSG